MPRQRLLAGYLTVMAALTGLFYAFPGQQLLTWSAIGLTSVAAVVIGVPLNRPGRRWPWVLLGAALLAFIAGDASWLVVSEAIGGEQAFPSVADAIYLGLFFPLAVAALLGLARTGLASRDRASLLDTLTLTAGAGLLAWTFLIRPYVHLSGLTFTERAISIAYPVFAVLLVATITRLATAVRWNPSVVMLVLGAVGLLVSDVLYGLSQLGGDWAMGGPVDLGWVVLYAAWGGAALHPSMRQLTELRPVPPGEVGSLRLAVLATASLVAPAVLVAQAAVGALPEVLVAGALTALMFLLVLSRLSGAVEVYRQSVARERGLREAGATLVATTSVDEVVAAVRTAIAQLLPPETPHRVVIERVADTDERPRAAPAPAGAGTRLPGFVPPATLRPELRRRLGHPEAVLRCRLPAADGTEPGSRDGALYIGAAARPLLALRGTTDVLASQAALALERIRLTSEINQRASEEYFRTLVQNAADVILIVNDDDTIRYASPSVHETLGVDRITGRGLHELVRPEDRVAVAEVLRALRTDPQRPAATADWAMVGPFGRRLQAEARCRNLRDDPTVAGLVITLRDVTEQRRLEHELAHRAFHDSLTGLPNRVLFQERMEHAITRGRRTGAVVGMLFLDLDDFKVVNDTMGHTAGDELLVRVGHRLTSLLRPEDTAARLGGDEFGALIEDARDPEEIEEVAERVVAGFAEPFRLGGLSVSGAVTVGVATTAEAPAGKDLLRQADLALYVAKRAGKGLWRRYRPADHAEVLRRMELRSALSRAVADEAFLLEYQPIVELASGRPAGMEALVRWRHPDRGTVAPDEFIEVAEESGLIVPIGDWVLEHAVADAAAWTGPEGGGRGAMPFLSLNVSARQFRQPGFRQAIRRTLETAGLPPSRLVVEITESVLMRDSVWADLAALRDLGIRVAIDDFGTGYSSLSYLRQLPVDIVKIEKSFLQAVSSSAAQLALVEGILGLADRLGLDAVAEGVERETDRDQLLRMGCRYGQGFLFAPPLSYGDAVKWVHATNAGA